MPAPTAKPKVKTAKPRSEEEISQEAFRLGETEDSGKWREAITLYEQLVAARPTLHEAWFNLGVLQSKVGRWRDAVKSLSQARKSKDLEIVSVWAQRTIQRKNGEQPSNDNLPEGFRGVDRYALGVHGPCYNGANALRKQGFTCSVAGKGESCTISAAKESDEYHINLRDFGDMMVRNVFRNIGGTFLNLGDRKDLTPRDQELMRFQVNNLPLTQAPLPAQAKKATPSPVAPASVSKPAEEQKLPPGMDPLVAQFIRETGTAAEPTKVESVRPAAEPKKARLIYLARRAKSSPAQMRLGLAALRQFTDELDADTKLKMKTGRDIVWSDPQVTMGGGGGVCATIDVYVPDAATQKRLEERFRYILSCIR